MFTELLDYPQDTQCLVELRVCAAGGSRIQSFGGTLQQVMEEIVQQVARDTRHLVTHGTIEIDGQCFDLLI